MLNFDLLIRNGLIYDGSGRPPERLDVAVNNGVIAEVAPSIKGSATREIDAFGKIVTPGFIDVHTHFDGQATWDERLTPSSTLGTTTVVAGNCGVGFAPCRPQDHEVLVKLMEGVEEIPGAALDEGLPWTWESFPEYLETLDRRRRDIDMAVLFPHGPLRLFVMGERGVNREEATAADIEQMKVVLKEGMDAGAVGFSTSRTLVHRSSSGDLIPTYKAATQELKMLGEVLDGAQGHVFQLISDWEDIDDEFSILKETSEKTGAKGTFTLIYLDTQPDLWHEQLARVEAAQASGLDIRGQVLSRPIGVMMGHRSSMNPFYRRPAYLKLAELSLEQRLEQLKDPQTKAQILAEENVNPHIFVQIFSERFDKMYVLKDPIDYLPAPENCVAARAAAVEQHPESWLYDYLLENEGRNLIYIAAANLTEHIPQMLGHPNTVVVLGDGGAHVGSICDASANIYLLTKWVRERGEFELAQAIHMLTRQPAELYSLLDRGLIEPGMKADLNVINFDALQLQTPHVVHDLPAGGMRFLQNVDGIEVTIVSGAVICEHGQATDALPGKLIRGHRSDPRQSA